MATGAGSKHPCPPRPPRPRRRTLRVVGVLEPELTHAEDDAQVVAVARRQAAPVAGQRRLFLIFWGVWV